LSSAGQKSVAEFPFNPADALTQLGSEGKKKP